MVFAGLLEVGEGDVELREEWVFPDVGGVDGFDDVDATKEDLDFARCWKGLDGPVSA